MTPIVWAVIGLAIVVLIGSISIAGAIEKRAGGGTSFHASLFNAPIRITPDGNGGWIVQTYYSGCSTTMPICSENPSTWSASVVQTK
jgi:hypothetical protein